MASTSEIFLIDGRPYVKCAPCKGTGDAQSIDTPFCTTCFGSGNEPLEALAKSVSTAVAEHTNAQGPSVDRPTFRSGLDAAEASNDGYTRKAKSFTNKFAGNCVKCGGRVQAGAGFRVMEAQTWATAHKPSECAQEVKTVSSTITKLATDDQITLLDKLVKERIPHADSLDEVQREFCRTGFRTMKAIQDGKSIGRKVMSDIITEIMQVKVPRTTVASNGYDAERGEVHVIDGEYHRVSRAQRTGRLYLVKATIITEAVWDGDDLVRAGEIEWTQAKGGMARLSAATKATAEQAKAFAMIVGRCTYCSREIDTPESIAVGYGPKCAEKHNLPWG